MPRSGATSDPVRHVLAGLALVGQLGLLVAGGAAAGFGLGYAVDACAGGRAGRIVGIVLGLASGVWTAGRQLMSVINARQGDQDS